MCDKSDWRICCKFKQSKAASRWRLPCFALPSRPLLPTPPFLIVQLTLPKNAGQLGSLIESGLQPAQDMLEHIVTYSCLSILGDEPVLTAFLDCAPDTCSGQDRHSRACLSKQQCNQPWGNAPQIAPRVPCLIGHECKHVSSDIAATSGACQKHGSVQALHLDDSRRAMADGHCAVIRLQLQASGISWVCC